MELGYNVWTYLGKFIEEPSPISLFSHVKASLNGDESSVLEAEGIIKNGKLTEPTDQIFRTIGGATNSGRIVLTMPSGSVEVIGYKTSGEPVLVENLGKVASVGLLSAEESNIRFQLAEHVGMSTLKHVDFAARLPEKSLLALLSIVDFLRKSGLTSMVSGNEAQELTITALAEYMSRPMAGGLTSLVTSGYQLPFISTEDLPQELANLESLGLIKKSGEEIQLAPEVMKLGLNFLLIEHQTLMEVFSVEGEEVVSGASLVFGAGLKDILAVTFDEGSYILQTISSATYLEWAMGHLGCPDL